jgi:hypothetical protein
LTPPESPAIEFTRFPPVEADDQDKEDGMLLRAADLIGQLGEPHHRARPMRFTMNSKKSA